MKLYIIQLLLIIALAITFVVLETKNERLMFLLYRSTIVYVVSKKLAILINGLESD
jgi:hypothetical protein